MDVCYQKSSDFLDKTHNDIYLLAHILMDQFSQQQDIPYCFQSGLRQIGSSDNRLICETWSSRNQVRYGKSGNIICARDDAVLLGCVELDQSLSLEKMTKQAYTQVFAVLEKVGFPHLIRMWHYVPRLNESDHGRTRYQLFCRGRNQALGFTQNVNAHEKRCATTVIGTDAEYPTMFFIATRNPGVALENAYQTKAWEYPQININERPLFARATWSPSLSSLFISGTASIVGAESKHIDSPVEQVRQIFSNLDNLLVQGMQIAGREIKKFTCLKAYVQPSAEPQAIQQEIKACLQTRRMTAEANLMFWGEVCRKELAVEIEAMCIL